MKKRFNLSKEIKLLLLKNQYYLKYNRNKKTSIYEENYHKRIKDPDGKIRDLTTEKKQKLRQLKYIVSYLKRKKPCKILDVGCGHGWLLSTLNSKWKKHGVEISKFASGSALKYCKIFNGDLEKYKEKNFDIITALHVIEHHPKPEKFIKEIYSKLKRNGILILETPDFDSAAARRFGNKFRLLKDKTHISLFSQDSLIRFLRDNKFKILDINYPYFETPFFTKKNLMRIFNKEKISPPFYGSIITVICSRR